MRDEEYSVLYARTGARLMLPASEGQSCRWSLWLWPAVFLALFTLALVAALLPWTDMERDATRTNPAPSEVAGAASAPAPTVMQDRAFDPAPPPGRGDEAASPPSAKAVDQPTPTPVSPPGTVGGFPTPLPEAMDDAASVPPPEPSVAGNGASGPEPAQSIDQMGMLTALLRRGSRPEGLTPAEYPGVDVLLATPVYFQFTGRRLPALDQPSIVFFVSEEVHIGELPSLPPRPVLKVGRIYHEPVQVRVLTDSPHHRTTIVYYNAAWSDGSPIVTTEARSLELVFQAASDASAASVLSWGLPISYGPAYSSRDVSVAGVARTPTAAAARYAGHTPGSVSGG